MVQYWFDSAEPDPTNPEMTIYKGRHTKTLLPEGNWQEIQEMEVVPVCKVITKEQAAAMGVEEPPDEMHIWLCDEDKCMRCGYNGQQAHHDREAGFEMQCLGWLGSPIG